MKFSIRRWALGCATLALALLPGQSLAQTQPAATREIHREPGAVERWHERYDRLRSNGLQIKLGSITPGSSLAAGVEFGRDRLLGTPIGGSIGAFSSVRGYHMYEVRLGRMKGREHRTELAPVDTDLTSVFNHNSRLAFGTSIFVHARERVYPRVDFFGLGQASEVDGRSDYGVAGSSVDLVGQWQRDRHFGVSGRVGTLDLRLRPGTNSNIPNTDTMYPPTSAPGLDAQHRYRVLGAAATLDYRDEPHMPSEGTFLGVAWWRGTALEVNDPTFNWTRLIAEVRQFVPWGSPDRVIAIHGLLSTRLGDVTAPTPFYLQPTLGGSKTLRGFGSYRLRGDAVWTATIEYRWRVHRRLQIAPFLDAGAVANQFSHLGDARVAFSPGIGLRAISHDRVIGRLDLVRSRDGNRAVLTLSAPF